jgi:pimeloyl-ACP methyl ester carboxylesterase
VRYARSWKAGADVITRDVEIERDGLVVPASLMLPPSRLGPLPGWIALGGVTTMGRFHPQLVRFSRALASSGAAVLLPEIPEWRRLTVPPGVTAPTVRACIAALRKLPEVRQERFGLIGFSFGAPQAAIAASREELVEHLAGVVLFGGYCCLERTLICQLTGEHEWKGIDYTLDPDPYGGWVVGSNYLTHVPGYEDASDVAGALHRLAAASSGERIPAWDPHHDRMIQDLRRAIPRPRQALFDLFAVPSTMERPARTERIEIAKLLAEACRRLEPGLDPAPELARVTLPTRLVHGRGDRLIPFTEGLRLMDGLPAAARKGATVTGLFNHSADRSPKAMSHRVGERVRMFEALRGVINTV